MSELGTVPAAPSGPAGPQTIDEAPRRRRAGPRLGLGTTGLRVGVGLVAVLVLLALLGPLVVTDDPTRVDLSQALLAPGRAGHLLGTDHLGRDVLSRTLHAARADLFLAFVSVLAPLAIGTVLGALAGYFRGPVDMVVSACIAVVFAFPFLVLVLALVFALGPGLWSIFLGVTIIGWVAYAQVVRGGVRAQKHLDYVLAAQVGGLSPLRILFRHVVPNVFGQALVYATSDMVMIILGIASLGFLGLGIPPPGAEWGSMISEAQPYISTNIMMTLAPMAGVMVTALALSLIGDGLAERLDVT
jgi:peptide/nickel transport system permease protein